MCRDEYPKVLFRWDSYLAGGGEREETERERLIRVRQDPCFDGATLSGEQMAARLLQQEVRLATRARVCISSCYNLNLDCDACEYMKYVWLMANGLTWPCRCCTTAHMQTQNRSAEIRLSVTFLALTIIHHLATSRRQCLG